MKRTHRRSALASALLVGISLTCGACAAIFGFEELGSEKYDAGGSTVDAPTSETGTDGGTDGPPTNPVCAQVGIPDKPVNPDSGSEDDQDILVAINTLDIGITTAAGFNLDRTCSPTQQTSSCIPGGSGTDFDEFGKDTDDKGTDNAGFALLKTVGAFGEGFEPKSINERLRDGEFGAVLRITKWNGTPDDTDIVFEVFPALGVSVDVGGGTFVRKTSSLDAGFAATDQWHRDTRFRGVSGVSTQFSLNAWVAGGRVYGRFAQLVIPVNVPDDAKPLDLTLKEAIISAKLEQVDGAWRLTDGVVGGRVATKDFLANVRTIYVRDNNGVKDAFLCTAGSLGPTLYGLVKTKVCAARDISGSGIDDRTKGCDAFSAGFRVDSYPLTNKGYYEGETNFEDLAPDATAPRCVTNPGVPLGDDCAPVVP